MPQPKAVSATEPSWMQEEEKRADTLSEKGQTANPTAPVLMRVTKEPPRMQKGLYIQEQYAHAFDELVLAQKKAKGPKATALAEEMIKDILIKYGQDTRKL